LLRYTEQMSLAERRAVKTDATSDKSIQRYQIFCRGGSDGCKCKRNDTGFGSNSRMSRAI